METFRPHSYTKAELAMLYFPRSPRIRARKRLMRWIHRCEPLVDELARLGHDWKQHYFTSTQVKAIVRYLDPPPALE